MLHLQASSIQRCGDETTFYPGVLLLAARIATADDAVLRPAAHGAPNRIILTVARADRAPSAAALGGLYHV